MKSFKLAGVKFNRYVDDGSENPYDFDESDFFPESDIYCLFQHYNTNRWDIKEINRIAFYYDKTNRMKRLIYLWRS